MCAFALLGFFGALGHHFYYERLHGQEVQDSQWPSRFGIALSFFVKTSLVLSVETAYKQQVWLTVKRRDFKVSTLDTLFSACSNPLNIFDKQLVSGASIASLLAVLLWCLPLCAIASPSTLTIQDGDKIRSTTCDNVSMIDFARENKWGLDSDDQERAGMSYWDTGREDGLYTYATPSSELQRIFKLSILSVTGPLKPPNPCPSTKSCTYSMDLSFPVYQCERRRQFGGSNPSAYGRSQFAPNGSLLYASYSSIDENDGGRPLTWDNITSSTQEPGVFTEIPSLWIGWVTDAGGYQPHIVECLLHNATSVYEVTFSGDDMTVNQTTVVLGPLLLPNGSVKAPSDDNYQQFSGYHAAGYLFRTFLSGNITSDPVEVYVDATELLQSDLVIHTDALHIPDNFETVIENRFKDVFLSMLSDTQLHSQFDLTTSCSITESVLVWHYEPFWLALSYIVAVSLTAAAVVVGAYGFHRNGRSMNTSFSNFMTTTRSPDLDKLAEGHCLGQWPMCKRIADAKLRFGELLVSSNQDDDDTTPHAAFAFPSSVQEIKSDKNYA
ncbi:hypothetical protein F5B20DRAFT_591462 [Whalleya microplaca]|nr:hypothetical protein F5B20DRAFT_591462 [Whalleya microplaca]